MGGVGRLGAHDARRWPPPAAQARDQRRGVDLAQRAGGDGDGYALPGDGALDPGGVRAGAQRAGGGLLQLPADVRAVRRRGHLGRHLPERLQAQAAGPARLRGAGWAVQPGGDAGRRDHQADARGRGQGRARRRVQREPAHHLDQPAGVLGLRLGVERLHQGVQPQPGARHQPGAGAAGPQQEPAGGCCGCGRSRGGKEQGQGYRGWQGLALLDWRSITNARKAV